MPNDERDGRTRTIGAVTRVLVTLPLDANRSGLLEAWAVVIDSGSGAGGSFKLEGAFRVNGAGVVTVVGVPTITPRVEASLASAVAVFGPVAGAIELRVTGVVGRTLQWAGELQTFVSG